MNLHRLLAQRAEAGKPVRVGLIGGGKFGTMFLAQARSTPGLQVLGVADLQPDRARRFMRDAGWPDEQMDAPDFDARALDRAHASDRRRRRPDRRVRPGRGGRGDRRPARRHPPCARRDRAWPAPGDGQRRSGRAGRSGARRAGPAGGPGVQPRLRRSAGVDLRDGRLGARLRLRRGVRRQGHALSAPFPPVDPRDRVAALRDHPRRGRGRGHEPEDVQQLRRRHQVGHRDGGGGQCHRPRAAEPRPVVLPVRHP